MRHRKCDDRGQAFPIYITVVAGLLFLAFAYFAVGQAAATRNGAQTAADAAALAATQHARQHLFDGFLDAIKDDGPWEDWLGSDGFSMGGTCAEADDFASRNASKSIECGPASGPEDGVTVKVETNYTVGQSIVPGSEDVHGRAEATAVIEPRCRLDDSEDNDSIQFTCNGEDWVIDPDEEESLPEAADLFSVYLSISPTNDE
ncbi:MAG TPA: hypothetical protein DEQ61_24285 [Streptomyces sp.]|nr:hypothetical protein [Streptomyces sp.]